MDNRILGRNLSRLVCSIALLAMPFYAFAQATSTSSTVEAPIEEAPIEYAARGDGGIYERAVVDSVEVKGDANAGGTQQVQIYHVRFRSGPFQDQSHEIKSDVGSNPYGLQPHRGDSIVVFMQPDGQGGWLLFLEGYDRRVALLSLVLLFVATLVLLSGWQGLKVALSICISIALIGYVLVPLFLRGANPVPVAIILAGIFTFVSAGLTTGWNKKSAVTAVGTMGGAMVAYLISLWFVDWTRMSGLGGEDDRLFFDKNPSLDPRGLLFAGIIIAAVGVLEDVAVSISSGVSEVGRHKPQASFRELFISGMVIGKDHMGALANTLVFAYVGSSLSTLMLYSQFGGSWLKFINFDSVVDEIVRSLAGTIGLVFTVPITALLAAWVTVASRPIDRHVRR